MAPMGFGHLFDPSRVWKRKFRWMLSIYDIIGDETEAIDVLMPFKAARPQLQFKEIEVNHIFEDIYLPGRPDWKPINIVLYETCPPKNHKIWDWIQLVYSVQNGLYRPINNALGSLKKDASLDLNDGKGNIIESWQFANSYPQTINFGELDMASADVVTCEITLRYDRAWRLV